MLRELLFNSLALIAHGIQGFLLHPDYAKSETAKRIRANLVPVVCFSMHQIALSSNFHVFIKTMVPAAVMFKSIEFGFATGSYYRTDHPTTTEQSSFLDKLQFTMHLGMSPRGVGWNVGVPSHKLAKPYTNSDNPWILILKIAQSCSFHSFLAYITGLYVNFLYEKNDWSMPLIIPSWEQDEFPVSCLIVGLFAWVNLYFSISCYTEMGVLFLATTTMLLHINPMIPENLRPNKPSPKDHLAAFKGFFPSSDSVAAFWGNNWHQLIYRQVYYVGVRPVQNFMSPLLGKKISGYLGILAGFFVSGIIHEHASETTALREGKSSMFMSTTVWFLINGVAIILEKVFTDITGRKVRGFWGRVWAYSVIITTGFYFYREWIERGVNTSAFDFRTANNLE